MLARDLSKSGLSVALIDQRIEIGAPLKCNGFFNKHDLRRAGIKPDDFIKTTLEQVEFYSDGNAFQIGISGTDEDVFNITAEADKVHKELSALAAIEGAHIFLRTRANGAIWTDSGFIRVLADQTGRKLSFDCRCAVIAGGGSDPISADFALDHGNIIEDPFYLNYNREVSRDGKDLARIAISAETGQITVSTPLWQGVRDNISFARLEPPGSRTFLNRIASGSGKIYLPRYPVYQRGGMISVGLQSGIWNPLFPSAFGYAIDTSLFAAEKISKFLDDGYHRVKEEYHDVFVQKLQLLGGKERELYRAFAATTQQGLDNFISNLKGFNYSTFSLDEILRRTGYGMEDLKSMLLQNH